MNQTNHNRISIQQVDSVLHPITEASGMPNTAYVSEEYFNFERDNILSKTWVCVGFASDLIKNGYIKPVEFMGLPLLMMRNREGKVQVFHNVCSHRGMKLVHEEGVVQGVIRCQYHSWSYDLDGNLKGTPHVGGIGKHKDERFKCEDHGLRALRSNVWMDMVFVNISGDAAPFEAHIAPLLERWKPFWGENGVDQIHRVDMSEGLEIEVDSNWKLTVENYCEAYHLPWVHPALNTYSKLEDHYNIMFEDRFAGQGSYKYNLSDTQGTHLPKFPSWPEDKLRHAEYVALFPNVLLGIQADHVFAMMIDPISAEKTTEKLRLYFVSDESAKDIYAACRTATLESWRVVFSEDITAVEGLQKGRHSPGFGGGVFSPEMDLPTHFFQKWLATQAKAALEKEA
ncbi:aromatic ring-hydroxylating dioxygenase subunit alpha [Psychrobacter sp. NG254]|uniref:aromatic ring-hydroxylating oxygenase subunit alpha n=1 Tax=Psychrobacter sp. NG254 TaxID=2782003 RepID=UPI0018870133|nr:aromatic ring-hydroxylating dioxygenase subunit alpha [Psychrobacter sp. NG254]MBF2720051.1 aromatic ring-hydroxylating dioxygenase subunit alpha [Psychrobacter sp. NG254]